MEQILFVLQSGKISQWNLSHGKLFLATDRGRRAVPYSSETANTYWDDWKENYRVADGGVYDAIFLSENVGDFGELPKWICADSPGKSAWTIEQLSLLAKEEEFIKGLCLIQGSVRRLIGTEKADDAIKLCLKSSLAFTLPKEVAKPKTPEPSKKSAAAEMAASGEAQIKPLSNMFIGDSYNDPEALSLKVGDKITCTVTSFRPMRGFCYLQSDKTSELIRVKLGAVNKTLSARASIVSGDMKLRAEVVAIKGQVVEYKIAI